MKGLIKLFMVLVLFASSGGFAQTFILQQTNITLSVHPGVNHLPISILISSNSPQYNIHNINVTANASWLTASIDELAGTVDLAFANSNLLVSENVMVEVQDGITTNLIKFSTTNSPLNLYRMVSDPKRSLVYGVNTNSAFLGSVLVVEPLSGQAVGNITVGKQPVDLSISALTDELLVLNSADATISVIDLAQLKVKETIRLPGFNAGAYYQSDVNVCAGRNGLIYYVDADGDLIVYRRSTKTILQRFEGLPNNRAVGDLRMSPDRQSLIVRYEGEIPGLAARYSIASSGLLTFDRKNEAPYPSSYTRGALNAPVLITESSGLSFVGDVAFDTTNITNTQKTFPSIIYSISPGGEIAASRNGIYEFETGNLLHTLHGDSVAQAISSDYSRLVYFDRTQRAIRTLDLVATIGDRALKRVVLPENGSVVLSPEKLIWPADSRVTGYRVYLGTDRESLLTATESSSEYLGQTIHPELSLSSLLTIGVTFFWRVDGVTPYGTVRGSVRSFTVSSVTADAQIIRGVVFRGVGHAVATLKLGAAEATADWQMTSDSDWLSFEPVVGEATLTYKIMADGRSLADGITNTTIYLEQAGQTVCSFALELKVESLQLEKLKSDPNSHYAYAISKKWPSAAYLLQIDTETEEIAAYKKLADETSDFAIHQQDNRIYAVNQVAGLLMLLDRDTLEIERSIPPKPTTYTYLSGWALDGVMALSSNRVLLDTLSTSPKMAIFDVATGLTLRTLEVSNGKDEMAGDSSYYRGYNYYIRKWAITNDVFTLEKETQLDSTPLSGQVLTVSENNNRVFWKGIAFTADLMKEWAIGDEIYATTPDGRYGFAKDVVYDVVARQTAFYMPTSGVVSAYNSHTKKLVLQNGDKLGFYPFSQEAPLIQPVLSYSAVSNNAVFLSWDDRSFESGYEVEYRIKGNSSWNSWFGIKQNANQTVMHSLSFLTTYEFRLRAQAPFTNSAWSEILTVTTLGNPPTSPTLPQPEVTTNSVNLVWSNVSGETGMVIHRRLSQEVEWSVLVTLPADSTTYVDYEVVPGNTYQYVIYATNQWYFSAGSRLRSAVVPIPTTPTQPVIGELLRQFGLVNQIHWPSRADAAGYHLERRTQGSENWDRIATLNAGTISYADTNVVEFQEYSYRLVAYNFVGESAPSEMEAIVSRYAAYWLYDNFEQQINPRTWLSVEGGEVITSTNRFIDGHALWLGGDGPRSATTVPVPIQSKAILEFDFCSGIAQLGSTHWEIWEYVELQWSTNGVSWHEIRTFQGADSWVHHSIVLPSYLLSQQTQFRWQQLNHSGPANDTWALDNVRLVGVAPLIPLAPPYIGVTQTTTLALKIDWVVSPGATQYVIERRLLPQDWEVIAKVGGDRDSYLDTDCVPSTLYTYRILALNDHGVSGYSRVTGNTTISDLSAWQFQNLGSTNASMTATGPDRVAYLCRYAFNLNHEEALSKMDPVNGVSGLPCFELDEASGKLEIVFLRRKSSTNPGITYEVQFSDDLVEWSAGGELVSIRDIDYRWEAVTWRDQVPLQKARYCRVAIRLVP